MLAPQARFAAREVTAALEKAGFVVARQSGSHILCKNAAGTRVTVPCYAGKVLLHPKLLRNIMGDADLNTEMMQALLP